MSATTTIANSPPSTTASAPVRAGSRLAVLDGLRLLAALMVVSYHYVGLGDPWDAKLPHGFPLPVYWASEYGFLGVELFFLISGFVICLSSLGRSLGDFFIARVVRLYPAYWFAIIATTIVVTLLPHVRKPLGVKDTLTNFTMLQIPLHVHDVDGVYWTLWAELRFYLLFSIVVAMGVTYRRVVAFCAIWTVGCLIALSVGGPLLTLVFLPAQAPYFIAGTGFFLIHRYGQNAMLWGIVGMSYLLAVHQLGVDPRIRHKFGHVPAWFAIVIISVFFALIALIALGKLTFGWRWLTTAGTLTYPLYLLHQHIGWAIIDKLQHRMPAPVLAGGVLALMLALAYAVHRFIERPLARRMKTILRAAVGPAKQPHGGVGLRSRITQRSRTAAATDRAGASIGRAAAPSELPAVSDVYGWSTILSSSIDQDTSTYERATSTNASE
ncbi:MAG TPA: acyltransferase [Micromonosporaceae bacterium]